MIYILAGSPINELQRKTLQETGRDVMQKYPDQDIVVTFADGEVRVMTGEMEMIK